MVHTSWSSKSAGTHVYNGSFTSLANNSSKMKVRCVSRGDINDYYGDINKVINANFNIKTGILDIPVISLDTKPALADVNLKLNTANGKFSFVSAKEYDKNKTPLHNEFIIYTKEVEKPVEKIVYQG